MQKTSIEWAGMTVNPIKARNLVTNAVGHFCERVSPGCANCYAAAWQHRFTSDGRGTGLDFVKRNRSMVRIFLARAELAAVVRRRKPTDYFWADMTDLFGDWVERDWLDACLATMVLTSRRHTHKLLTKRPERAREYLLDFGLPDRLHAMIAEGRPSWPWEDCAGRRDALRDYFDHLIGDAPAWPPRNVLIGASIENQAAANERGGPMRAMRQAGWFTWISAEPLLGPVDLVDQLRWLPIPAGWVVAGGESGPAARPMAPEWPRLLRDQCKAAGVPFFFKQWGRFVTPDQMPPETYAALDTAHNLAGHGRRFWGVGKKRAGRLLDGREWTELPAIQTELGTCPSKNEDSGAD